jgi:ComF family protein
MPPAMVAWRHPGKGPTLGHMAATLDSLFKPARIGGRWLLDLALPPRCAACREPVADPMSLCAPCWSALKPAAGALCAQCGIPLPTQAALGGAMKCLECLNHPPAFTSARAAWLYDDTAAKLILPLKHSFKPHLVQLLARAMARAGADLLADPQAVLVPVPLHRWRLARRGYNQAAELAKAIAKLSGRPVLVEALARTRATPAQQGLDRAARAQNMRKAFAVARPDQIANRPVVLVDDVLTTGATAHACAAALLKAGAAHVSLLTAARVETPG